MTRFTLILDDTGEEALKVLLKRAQSAAEVAGLGVTVSSRNGLIQSLIVSAAAQTGPK